MMDHRLARSGLVALAMALALAAEAFAQGPGGPAARAPEYRALPFWFPSAVLPSAGGKVRDGHVVDPASARWRTGAVDPAVVALPPGLDRRFKADPEGALVEFIAYLKEGSASPFQTAKRAHDWITLNTAYDDDKYYGRRKGSSTAVDVIRTGLATCGGLAAAFEYLCAAAGVECVMISGLSRVSLRRFSAGEGARVADHAWNAIRIGASWYIVDCTYDGRRGYEFGVLGELKPYSDANLFLSPAAKLVSSRADREEEQLVPEPISLGDFLSRPLVTACALQEGVFLDLSPLGARLGKAAVYREDRDQATVVDLVRSRGGELSIILSLPYGAAIRATLEDAATGAPAPLAVSVDQGGVPDAEGRVEAVARFRPERSGVYAASIAAARLGDGTAGPFRTVYAFDIALSSDEPGASAYEPGLVYAAYARRLYRELGAQGDGLSARPVPSDPSWVSLDAVLPAGMELFATYRDETGMEVPGAIATSLSGPGTKRYYIRPLPGGRGIFTLYAKRGAEERFNHAVACLRPAASESGPAGTAPLLAPLLRKAFHERGYSLAGEAVQEGPGIWTLAVKGPPGNFLRAAVRAGEGGDAPFSAQVLRAPGDSGAVVRFALPDGGGPFTGRLYWRSPEGTLSTILTLVLPAGPAGQRFLPPLRAFEHADTPPGAVRLFLEPRRGAAACALRTLSMPGYGHYIAVFRPDGTRVEGEALKAMYALSYSGPAERVYYFLPAPGPGYAIAIMAGKAGASVYGYAWSMGLPSASPWPGGAPAAAKEDLLVPLCSTLFASSGLVLDDWEAVKDSATIAFEGPGGLDLSAGFYDPDGKAVVGGAVLEASGLGWSLRFIYPASRSGTFVGKLFVRDAKGSRRIVLTLSLPPSR